MSESVSQQTEAELKAALGELLASHSRILVITGAGVSTASGIGDYRDTKGDWKRPQPVKHQAFMSSHQWRQRYWARSQLGYPSFRAARPNATHAALANLERDGRLVGLITQNVDRLHQQAGQQNVIDLHGRLDRVICMSCESMVSRGRVQQWLEEHNPDLLQAEFASAPDGDADILMDFSSVNVPECAQCGGILKPHVVFFGDTVRGEVVDTANRWVDEADAMLILGSSLMVFSGFRFVRRAHERGIPIAAINRGVTRADALLSYKLQADCGAALQEVIRPTATQPDVEHSGCD